MSFLEGFFAFKMNALHWLYIVVVGAILVAHTKYLPMIHKQLMEINRKLEKDQ